MSRPVVPGGAWGSGLQALFFPRQGPPAAPTAEAGLGGRGVPGETGRGPNCTEAPAPPFSPCCVPRPFVYTHVCRPHPGSKARFKRKSLRLLRAPYHPTGRGRSREKNFFPLSCAFLQPRSRPRWVHILLSLSSSSVVLPRVFWPEEPLLSRDNVGLLGEAFAEPRWSRSGVRRNVQSLVLL